MKKMQDFADALIDEGLSEAANTFFGKRKRLEEEVFLFYKKCKELRDVGEKVLDWGHRLGFLLLRGKAVTDFYVALSVILDDDVLLRRSSWDGSFSCPRALFRKSRYVKCVYAVYCRLYASWDLYQHGRYYKDPSRVGGKKQSINFTTVKDWEKRINDKIESINRDNNVSQVLQFAKQFRVDEAEKERIAGADLVYTIDNDLAFSPIDPGVTGILHFPQLPAPQSVRRVIRSFCDHLYDAHKETIDNILDEVKKNEPFR